MSIFGLINNESKLKKPQLRGSKRNPRPPFLIESYCRLKIHARCQKPFTPLPSYEGTALKRLVSYL